MLGELVGEELFACHINSCPHRFKALKQISHKIIGPIAYELQLQVETTRSKIGRQSGLIYSILYSNN